MILPLLDYGSFVMDGSSPGWLCKMQTVQNHALRLCEEIWDARDADVDVLHAVYDIEKLQARRNSQLLGIMFKRSQKEELTVPHPRQLRGASKIKLKVAFPHKDIYLKSPLYRGMLSWNKLTALVQCASSRDAFMNKLKK
jgi:hypothetical protein